MEEGKKELEREDIGSVEIVAGVLSSESLGFEDLRHRDGLFYSTACMN